MSLTVDNLGGAVGCSTPHKGLQCTVLSTPAGAAGMTPGVHAGGDGCPDEEEHESLNKSLQVRISLFYFRSPEKFHFSISLHSTSAY